MLTKLHDCLVKNLRRAVYFAEISSFKFKRTKSKVNNENVSDVNIDETADDALITNEEVWMKFVSQYFDFSANFCPLSLVFKMGLLLS